jgi:hypothetical protein
MIAEHYLNVDTVATDESSYMTVRLLAPKLPEDG